MGNSKVPDVEGAAVAPQETAAPTGVKKKYLATFTANRSFEAHVGGEVIPFGPYGSVQVDEDTANHSDFKAIVAAGLLQVKEVSK
jgi:hypothetical protein